MRLVDLGREIHHKAQRLPNHPTIEVHPFSGHGGTHVDAPVHFDQTPGAMTIDRMPLETFFTEAPCLDLTHAPDRTGITAFTVESVSPGRPGRNNFEVHHLCRDMGFTHDEGAINLDQVVGKGHFRFLGLPLKIKGARLPAVALHEA